MKIALVFDDLIQFGGAERLLLAVCELYPNVSVYTSLASSEWLQRCADKKIQLVTSFMQHLPAKKSLNRFYGLLGLHFLAFSSFKFDDYDIVLSISSRFAHAIITKPQTIHICYMNSPARMFWEAYDYFDRERFLQNRLIKTLFWFFATPFLSVLRLYDYICAQRVDFFIANSKTPQSRIKKYYKRDSCVIYPFVDDFDAYIGDLNVKKDRSLPLSDSYYLVITRLNAWKRVDIAIEACINLGLNLKIIGEGPDKARLVKFAKNVSGSVLKIPSKNKQDKMPLSRRNSGRIEFLGYIDEKEKVNLIRECIALIITQKEDFGITALEAMSFGKPVIAYKSGGVLETVVKGKTGEFFSEQKPQSLCEILSQFNPANYKKEDCIKQARKFSKQKFLGQLDEFVKKVYDSKNNLQ